MLDKIIDFIAIQIFQSLHVNAKTSFTACGKVWNFYKIGNVVFVEATTDIHGAQTGITEIGTLPDVLRPRTEIRLRPANVNNYQFMNISTNGKVTIYNGTGSALGNPANNAYSGSYIAKTAREFLSGGGYCKGWNFNVFNCSWRHRKAVGTC